MIVDKILFDNKSYQSYINFLKNGTNKPAIEVLKEIDIDLTTEKPYEIAFNFIKKQLELYKSLNK